MTREPSPRSLEILPDIAIRRASQSLAMLDASLSPDWDLPYYSFNAAWGPDEQMASMGNGSGDEYFILVNSALNPDLQANDVISDAVEIGYSKRTSQLGL